MNSETWVAMCSLVGSAIGAFGGINLINWRLKQLEKKVEKHNNFAERIPVLEEKIKVEEHRITDLEDAYKK